MESPFHAAFITFYAQIHQMAIKSGIIHSQNMGMEAVVIQCGRLNHSRYQITITPREFTVVPKFIRMRTIDSSYMDQNLQIYKIWDHS
jgi:hypothetical protein